MESYIDKQIDIWSQIDAANQTNELIEKIILSVEHLEGKKRKNAEIITNEFIEYIQHLVRQNMNPSFYNSLYTP